jgi:hypothetical protein
MSLDKYKGVAYAIHSAPENPGQLNVSFNKGPHLTEWQSPCRDYASGVDFFANENYPAGTVILEAVGVIKEVTIPAKSVHVEPHVGMRIGNREILKLFPGMGGAQMAVVFYENCGRVSATPVDLLKKLHEWPRNEIPAQTKRVFHRFNQETK